MNDTETETKILLAAENILAERAREFGNHGYGDGRLSTLAEVGRSALASYRIAHDTWAPKLAEVES
jgi:hypothetical protein